MPAKKEISLLPDEDNINTFTARAGRWLSTVGRYVIVFTELIVIGAFLSRFWLDRINSDLSEVVRQQTAILESTTDFEKEFSLLQRRLNVIKDFYANQPIYQNKIESLVESTPLDINYSALNVSNDPKLHRVKAGISLFAYSESSIVNFITNLVANPQISSVIIDSIEKKPRDNRYSVAISLVFAPDKK